MLDRVRNSPPIRGFRRFRESRPFWAALFVLFAGLEIAFLPFGPTNDLVHAGKGTFVALAIAGIILLMGLAIMFAPSQRLIAGVIAVAAGVASLPLSNLGGLVVGMIAAIIGGSMAFGWVPDKGSYRRADRRRLLPRKPRDGAQPADEDRAAADAAREAALAGAAPPAGRADFDARPRPT